jgi:hypothetical protein
MILYVNRRLSLGTTLFKVLTSRDSVLYVSRVVDVRSPRYSNVLAYRKL